METRSKATQDGRATRAGAVSLETSFLLSVFAELSGRPRPKGCGADGPAEASAPPSDRAAAER